MFVRRGIINNFLSTSARQAILKQMTATTQKLTFCELQQGKPSFPREEEKIIEYWREIDAFKTQLEKTKDCKPFTFYEYAFHHQKQCKNTCVNYIHTNIQRSAICHRKTPYVHNQIASSLTDE